MSQSEEQEKEYPIIRRADSDDVVKIEIPICCREGHDDCPHVAKPPKKKKTNVGL
jgi:hypothetical protein